MAEKKQSLKDIIAEQEQAAAAAAKALEEAQAKAQATLNDALAEHRSKRDALLAKATKVREQLAELEQSVEAELGIPAAVFNADIAPQRAVRARNSSGNRKRYGTNDIGPVGPVVITAPGRRAGGTVSVQYVIRENNPALGPELLGARVESETPQEDLAYSHSSYQGEGDAANNRPSAVISGTGWHETNDVLFALAKAKGVEVPVEATSPLNLIRVNGEPLAAPKSVEATKETV